MRITLIIHSMGTGGAERAMATMANYWAAMQHEVTLLTFDNGKVPSFYPLHPKVAHRPLGIEWDSPGAIAAVRSNVQRVRALRQAVKRCMPQVVVSLMTPTNVVAIIATRGLNVPLVVEEQVDPGQHFAGRAWDLLRKWTYPYAACVVALTTRSLNYFPAKLHQRMKVIPNPIVVSAPEPHVSPRPSHMRRVVAMGRLDQQKGFDLLVDAFSRIASAHPEWKLEIWGQGEKRGELEALIQRMQLADRVGLPGVTDRPHDLFRQSDFFVMSSRYEGFPLVLCEALACGLPVVSFDCPTGPREIIREGIDGLLVPPGDVPALAAAMNQLMSNEDERLKLGSRAPEVLQRFGAEPVMRQWDELLSTLVRA